ncbi:Mth938-like domain-containing protein [Hylemonella sp. W303a]|uniref:Mth938-like domain-containing protein n=1 Tax=Hylemonella sp. W303a TaxID=3389873 RepID=UPI00396B4453
MKLHADSSTTQTIRGHGPGWIAVESGGQTMRYSGSLVLGSRGLCRHWDAPTAIDRFEDLQVGHFTWLAQAEATRPELVLFGSGVRLRFPRPQWLRSLADLGIGVETMDTPAACRTYNILAGEGRHVLAALVLEPALVTAQAAAEAGQ